MTHAAIVLCYFPNVEYKYGHNAKNKRPMSKQLDINALFPFYNTTCPKLGKNKRRM